MIPPFDVNQDLNLRIAADSGSAVPDMIYCAVSSQVLVLYRAGSHHVRTAKSRQRNREPGVLVVGPDEG